MQFSLSLDKCHHEWRILSLFSLVLSFCNDSWIKDILIHSLISYSLLPKQLAANTLLYSCINFSSLYCKYLTDCAQRNAFLETRRSMETRYKIEKENAKQVSITAFHLVLTHFILLRFMAFYQNTFCLLFYSCYLQWQQTNRFVVISQSRWARIWEGLKGLVLLVMHVIHAWKSDSVQTSSYMTSTSIILYFEWI